MMTQASITHDRMMIMIIKLMQNIITAITIILMTTAAIIMIK